MKEQPEQSGAESKDYSHIEFPEYLTPKDIELIIKQSQIQDADRDHEVLAFAQAYAEAKELALDEERVLEMSAEDWHDQMLKWGELIEPVDNANGWRRTQVRFRNGSTGLEPDKIPRAMKSFSGGFATFVDDPFEDERLNAIILYTQFEKIHPLDDGNGRVGDLLWKIARTRVDGEWPETLPPDVFGPGK